MRLPYNHVLQLRVFLVVRVDLGLTTQWLAPRENIKAAKQWAALGAASKEQQTTLAAFGASQVEFVAAEGTAVTGQVTQLGPAEHLDDLQVLES